MSDLEKLYQKVILDHNKNPRNFYKPENSNRTAEGYNPVCGDKIAVYVRWENEKIVAVGFQGSGCAISRASASMMTDCVQGKNRIEVDTIHANLQKMLKESNGDGFDQPGELKALSGVRQFPVRIKCAVLPWETLIAALNENSNSVSTE
jgi:nitrogen fixation protein NifU and related proteins